MPKVSLSMKKIEEVLRLKYKNGLSHRAIAKSCRISASTVSEYVTHAKAAGLSWPLPEGMTPKQLETRRFPGKVSAGRQIPQLDWRQVNKELKRKGGDAQPAVDRVPSGASGRIWIQPVLPTLSGMEKAPQPHHAAQSQSRGKAVCRLRRADGGSGGP